MVDLYQNLYSGKERRYFAGARVEIEPLLPDTIDHVLEIGCGTGATMRWLRNTRRVAHATGIELVPEAAKEAGLIFDDLLVGNIEQMSISLPVKSLDVIFALDVLEHLTDPWLIVRRCHELLKPGGILIASIPNIGHYTVSLPLLLRGIWNYESEGLLDRTHLRFFVAKTAVELMTSSGLILEHIERVCLKPLWLRRVPTRRLRWYVQRAMDSLPAHLFDYQFLIRVRCDLSGCRPSSCRD